MSKRVWTSTPIKSPRGKKHLRVGSTPTKIKGIRAQTTSKSTAARMIENSNYSRAFSSLYKNFRGARKAIIALVKKTIRKELNQLSKCNSHLSKPCTMESLNEFDWDDIITELRQKTPMFLSAILSALSSDKSEENMECLSTKRNLKPATVVCISQALHVRFPWKFKLLQGITGIEMWRHGSQRKLFEHFNRIGLCTSRLTTMRLLSKFRLHADNDLIEMKENIENLTEPNPDITVPAVEESDDWGSVVSSDVEEMDFEHSLPSMSVDTEQQDPEEKSSETTSTGSTEDNEMDIQQLSSSESSQNGACPGYCLVWDNVGKEVRARHQNTDRQNKMQLWALCYAAKNRIATTHLDGCSSTEAVEIPLHVFLPTRWDIECIQSRLKYLISKIVVEHIPSFTEGFKNVIPRHYRHSKWRESSQKSEVINLGVLNENPSTIAGTINILQNLHQYVPERNGKVVKLLSYGDGLTCERHNDAHKARANGATPADRIEGLEPAVQEFHKRMLMMQDILDQFYSGSSMTDKGTFCHLRNMFGHRNITKDVGQSFNHVADFMYFITVGYTIVLVTKILEMDALHEEPVDWCELDAMTKQDKQKYMDDLSDKVVTALWRDLKVENILSADEENAYLYCICKEDKDRSMIECSGVHCGRGKWFHLDCVKLQAEDVPDGDWFCSKKCEKSVRAITLTGAAEFDKDDKVDYKHQYVTSLLLCGLVDMAQRDCVRENDGPMLMRFWKMNIIQFHNRNHHKYVILAHRLIAGISGWLPHRLQQDLIWNRTVNLSGGPGRNLEMDLVNEMLNNDFKDSLRAAGGNITDETVARHSQLVGHLGQKLEKMFGKISGVDEKSSVKTVKRDMEKDLKMFISVISKENLFDVIPGRQFKAFPEFQYHAACKDPMRLKKKLKQLSKRLDRLKKITN